MPRKNHSKPHEYYTLPRQDAGKRRFATKVQAEAAAEERMLLDPKLQLYVYKGLDGGWYLTRKESGPS
jgi:hypothetical protein